MKWRSSLPAALWTTTLLACGGGEPPEAAQEESPPPPQGVHGQAPQASQGIASVVVLDSETASSAAVPAEPAVMDQLGLAFLPRQLIVRLGQPVEFLNSETLAHNVHLHYEPNDSSVYYADFNPNDRSQVVLEQAGAYAVTCDEHPGMTAFIYVTTSPYTTFADIDGSFIIPDVPPGSYTARVWNATRDLRSERPLRVSGSSTEVDLTASP